jgi:hypothetical protein
MKYSRSVWRYQRSNHNPYIEEEQTTQWPKEKSTKGQTTIYKTYLYIIHPWYLIICKAVKYIDQSDNSFLYPVGVLIPQELVGSSSIWLFNIWTPMWPHTECRRVLKKCCIFSRRFEIPVFLPVLWFTQSH